MQLLHFCLHSPSKFLSVSPLLTLGKLPKSAQCGSGIHTGLLECVSLLNQECSAINVLTLCPRDGAVPGGGGQGPSVGRGPSAWGVHPADCPLPSSAATVPFDSLGLEYRDVALITMKTAYNG